MSSSGCVIICDLKTVIFIAPELFLIKQLNDAGIHDLISMCSLLIFVFVPVGG